MRHRRLGFERTVKHTLTLAKLQCELERGLYPIVYVNLLPLDGIKGAHVFALIAQSEDSITVYDPLRGECRLPFLPLPPPCLRCETCQS